MVADSITFDNDRLRNLRSETHAFRDVVKERLANYFKGHPSDEVVRIMADWIDMDDLLELEDRISLARKILNDE